MTGSLEVQVLREDELVPVLARCAEEGHLLDAALHDTAPPDDPGVYVWQASGLVVYVGEAAALKRRLTEERGWVSGSAPGEQRWDVSVVHLLRVHRALPRWARAVSTEAALLVERRLIEWHRACVGIAPLAVGWDTRKDSRGTSAESWVRDLWREEPAARPDVGGEP